MKRMKNDVHETRRYGFFERRMKFSEVVSIMREMEKEHIEKSPSKVHKKDIRFEFGVSSDFGKCLSITSKYRRLETDSEYKMRLIRKKRKEDEDIEHFQLNRAKRLQKLLAE